MREQPPADDAAPRPPHASARDGSRPSGKSSSTKTISAKSDDPRPVGEPRGRPGRARPRVVRRDLRVAGGERRRAPRTALKPQKIQPIGFAGRRDATSAPTTRRDDDQRRARARRTRPTPLAVVAERGERPRRRDAARRSRPPPTRRAARRVVRLTGAPPSARATGAPAASSRRRRRAGRRSALSSSTSSRSRAPNASSVLLRRRSAAGRSAGRRAAARASAAAGTAPRRRASRRRSRGSSRPRTTRTPPARRARAPTYAGAEQHRHATVDERPRDHAVDVVEAVAQDRDAAAESPTAAIMIGTMTARRRRRRPKVNTSADERTRRAATSAPNVSHLSCWRSRPRARRKRRTIDDGAAGRRSAMSRATPIAARARVKTSPPGYGLSTG